MAKYDYMCLICKIIFEKEFSFSEVTPKKVKCPNCQSNETKKTISSPPLVLYVGEGFYSTDNKK